MASHLPQKEESGQTHKEKVKRLSHLIVTNANKTQGSQIKQIKHKLQCRLRKVILILPCFIEKSTLKSHNSRYGDKRKLALQTNVTE